MTVKEIREYIADLPDSMEVTISDGRGALNSIDDINSTITIESWSKPDSNVQVVVLYSRISERPDEGADE